MKISVIVAAAGIGERYRRAGGKNPKLLHRLPDGDAVFQATLNKVMATGFDVTVVTRPEYQFIQPEADPQRLDVIRLASSGLGESIAAGVRHRAGYDGWLIVLADMPFISTAIMVNTATALATGPTARPFYRGQPGHPVGFSAALRETLLALRGDDGAKSILKTWPPQRIEVNDASVIQDIDLPDLSAT